jgi:hypothetical protein
VLSSFFFSWFAHRSTGEHRRGRSPFPGRADGKYRLQVSSPGKVGDMRLSLSINRIGKSSLGLLNASGKFAGAIRVHAILAVVLASLKTMGSIPFPDDMRTRLECYVVPPPG